MNNLTLLETIFIIYIIVVNVLGVIAIIMASYASNKASDMIFLILFGVAIPITLPMVLYLLTFDKLKHRKRKQDLEKQFDDFVMEKENDKGN
jgi:heme/copper-type cytochrome/quinol oxidase subunit 2